MQKPPTIIKHERERTGSPEGTDELVSQKKLNQLSKKAQKYSDNEFAIAAARQQKLADHMKQLMYDRSGQYWGIEDETLTKADYLAARELHLEKAAQDYHMQNHHKDRYRIVAQHSTRAWLDKESGCLGSVDMIADKVHMAIVGLHRSFLNGKRAHAVTAPMLEQVVADVIHAITQIGEEYADEGIEVLRLMKVSAGEALAKAALTRRVDPVESDTFISSPAQKDLRQLTTTYAPPFTRYLRTPTSIGFNRESDAYLALELERLGRKTTSYDLRKHSKGQVLNLIARAT